MGIKMSKMNLVKIGLVIMIVVVLLAGCTEKNQNSNNDDINDEEQYDWSTMNEGPYHDKVTYATSTDLFNWTDSDKILAEHASVPGAVYKEGIIYVYFVDVSVDGIPEHIGLMKSDDNGQTWSEKEYAVFEGIGDKVPVDPAPVLLDDGRIRLYYFDINEERTSTDPAKENKIYSAVSSNGVNFVQENDVRFSKTNIYDPDVIKVVDTWHLYVGDIFANHVISAVSKDGLTFTEEGTAYDGGAVPDVFFKNDIFYLFTAGIDISTSSNGSTFTKSPYSFHSESGMITADPSVIELNDGTYIMLYKVQ